MKNLHKSMLGLAVLVAILFQFSCNPDEGPRIRPFDLTVMIGFPDDYSATEAAGAKVTIKELASGSVQEQTASADGRVDFTQLVPGAYELSANLQLTAEQAEEIVGISVPLNLNYLDNNLMLTAEVAEQGPLEIQLSGSASGGLIIKQLYYSGSKTPEGSNYFFDQFYEIYNNSDEAIALDGLLISNVYGPSGLINPNTAPSPFADDQDNVYISTAWRFPGSGEENILQPYTGVLIAQQGINHQEENANPSSPVNLSNADFELFVTGSTRDIDAPNVPNMVMVYHPFNATFSLVPVFGPGTILWKTEDFGALEQVSIPDTSPEFPRVVKVPKNLVIDAVEALRSETDGAFKRIPVSLDAGFSFVSNTYTGESIIRKSVVLDGHKVYQDSNNSSEDFILLDQPELP
ncbi:DUF4876 domain-containing protein [Belliella marina]|uniref:DUF4876 domain-containing protein n=1 Tax=Belliella marina TaxID=1644146 RepID=A0ABW4VMT7_9BACT